MKKIIHLSLIATVFFANCSPTESPKTETKTEPETVSTPIDSSKLVKEELGLNLKTGETYLQNSRAKTSIIQTMAGQEVKMTMDVISKLAFKVLDFKDNVYSMEVKYQSMILKMGLPGGEKEFNSEKIDKGDLFSTLLGSMKNKPFLIKMTKTGKITEVKNVESMVDGLVAKLPNIGADKKQQVKAQLMQAYGEKAFKGNLEMSSAIFSDTPVAIGNKWNISTKLESGMSANIETVYELKESTDSYCKIAGTSQMQTADKDAYVEANGMPLRYDMKGTMNSDIKIDKKTGWIMNATIHQSFDGTAFIKDNPTMPGGMSIPMKMINDMTITE